MKQGRPYNCEWPRPLLDALRTYLAVHRPVLAARAKDAAVASALWISQFGRGMPAGAVGQIICRRTLAAFGRKTGPDFMRYVLATTAAERMPQNITDAAAMLGPASLETTERHYSHANGVKAAAAYQDVLAGRAGVTRRKA